MAVFSSPVDAGFRYTSGFSRSRTLGGKTAPHAGSDYAPPTPNQRGTKARSVAAGTVIEVGTGVLAGHSGKIVVVDHGRIGKDRTITNYGHLDSIAVKKGQRVSAGTILGTVGSTGRVTGVHLHFGVRFNGVYYDPHAWLGRKGIVPGRTAPIRPEGKVTTAGTTITSRPSTTTPVLASRTTTKLASLSVKHSVAVRTIQQRLKTMGYTILVDGVDGPKTRKVIAEYQKTQRSPYTLYADGVWGPRSEAHYKWTVALQTTVNKWKSDYRKLSTDGHYGANTVAYVRNVQKRNYGGKYKGAIDGIPGRVFCRMIGITTHP